MLHALLIAYVFPALPIAKLTYGGLGVYLYLCAGFITDTSHRSPARRRLHFSIVVSYDVAPVRVLYAHVLIRSPMICDTRVSLKTTAELIPHVFQVLFPETRACRFAGFNARLVSLCRVLWWVVFFRHCPSLRRRREHWYRKSPWRMPSPPPQTAACSLTESWTSSSPPYRRPPPSRYNIYIYVLCQMPCLPCSGAHQAGKN